MNERIKELAEQVDEWFREDGHSYSRPAWNEKLAELIVRECANICYNEDFTNGSAYGNEIWKHFGVK